MNDKTRTEEFKISGEELLEKVKEIIREGNARKLIIKDEGGKTLIEVPLTIGVVGGAALAMFAPVLVAIGAIAGILAKCTLVVERVD
jgi:hypothetical protein